MLEAVSDTDNISGAVQFDVSDTGSLVYIPDTIAGLSFDLVWVERNGNEETTLFESRPYRHPRVSPDGNLITVELEESNDTNVWLGEVRRGASAA